MDWGKPQNWAVAGCEIALIAPKAFCPGIICAKAFCRNLNYGFAQSAFEIKAKSRAAAAPA